MIMQSGVDENCPLQPEGRKEGLRNPENTMNIITKRKELEKVMVSCLRIPSLSLSYA